MNAGIKIVVIAFLLSASITIANDRGAVFTSKPVVTKTANGAKIDFAVSQETDVAVYIENNAGKVVRHLVAGQLGKNPPAPLKAGSLQQSLEWDGKNDLGQPAGNGPFKVRVGLGLKPVFDKMIGFNAAAITSVRSLAVNTKGDVFVFYCFSGLHPGDASMGCSVFDRNGNYLRTIMPYPANLPEDKLKGIKRIELENGSKVPFLYQGETRSLIPGAGDNQVHNAIATKDGKIAFVGRLEYERYDQPGPLHLVVLNDDGSIPDNGPLQALIFNRGLSATLALSPDEKTIYASDVRMPGGAYGKPQNLIYKFTWDDKEAQVLIAADAKDDAKLDDPKGICTDKDGNLIIADKGNSRIARFKPDGTFIDAIKFEKPERVSINSKTGAIYVLSGANLNLVSKLKSWQDPQVVAKQEIPFFKNPGYRVCMAMDDQSANPVLWFGTHASRWAKYTLLRIEDRGDSFGEAVDIANLPQNQVAGGDPIADLSVDRENEGVYVNHGPRYNARTGKVEPFSIDIPKTAGGSGATMVFGLDGHVYAQIGKDVFPGVNRIYKFDCAGKPVPYTNIKDNYIERVGLMRLRARGLTADSNGKLYVILQKTEEDKVEGDHKDASLLAVIGPDGKLINNKLIDSEIRSLNSVRVDYQGNVYLLLGLRAGQDKIPVGLKGKIPETDTDPDAVLGKNYYPLMYGSIAKFGPEGGQIRTGIGGVVCNYNYNFTTEVKGAQWLVSEASNVPSWRTGTKSLRPDICLCESPRFDVDGFGRSFYPDALRFRVGVLDTAGNTICTFGSYGNQDSYGTNSPVPTPEIPLAWVQAVAVSDEAAYVGDRLNKRVVRVKLGYTTEAVTPL